CVAFGSDGRTVVVGGSDSKLRRFRVAFERSWTGQKDNTTALAFVPGKDELVSAASDGVIKLWNAIDGRELQSFEGSVGAVHSVSVREGGGLIWGGGDEKFVRGGKATGGTLAHSFPQAATVNSLVLNDAGTRLATATMGGVRLWDMATGREVESFTEVG